MQKHEWLAVVTLCVGLLFLTIVSHFSYFAAPWTYESMVQSINNSANNSSNIASTISSEPLEKSSHAKNSKPQSKKPFPKKKQKRVKISAE